MRGPTFYKVTGSGNDFVVLDGREQELSAWPAERIRAVCDRRRGVGADGIAFLTPAGPAAVQMVYFNADGSRVGMCGNAALCCTRLAASLGLGPPQGMDLHTDSGVIQGRCVGPGWAAELLFPELAVPAPIDLPLESGERCAFQGVVGVPHTVLVVADVETCDVLGRGRELRFADRFLPDGTNVNFLGPDAAPDEAPWRLRTYERGVEGETLACGTGTVAAALVVATAGLATLPVRIRSASGALFSVTGILEGGTARDVWLCGEGRLVFEGTLSLA